MRNLAILAFVFLFGCGEKGGEEPKGKGSSGDGYSNVFVTLKQKLALTNIVAACHVQDAPQGPAGDGTCITPTNIEMFMSGINLTYINYSTDTSKGPGRILGGGSGLGKDGYIEGALFSLASPGVLQGEDNLFHHYGSTKEWDALMLNFVYMRIFFTVKSENWEMIVPFYPQPLENEQWVKDCFDEPYIANMKTRANPITGISYKVGDYLFCKQTSGKCNFSDFKWFDKTTKQLSATRPTTPRRFEYLEKNTGGTCNRRVSDNSPPDVTNKNVSVFANINSPKFKLFADFSHGEGSESNKGGQSPAGITAADWEAHLAAGKPGDPHFIYTLERSGQKSTGNKLDFKFTFDLTDYLFADKITDINSATIEQILEVITTKDIFLREGTQPGNEFAPQMKVDVAVTVSQAPLAELYKTPTPGATPAPASN